MIKRTKYEKMIQIGNNGKSCCHYDVRNQWISNLGQIPSLFSESTENFQEDSIGRLPLYW